MWFKIETYKLPSIEEIKMTTKENRAIRDAKEKILNDEWTNKAIGKIAKAIRKAARNGDYYVTVKLSDPDYADRMALSDKIEAAGYRAEHNSNYSEGCTFHIYWK